MLLSDDSNLLRVAATAPIGICIIDASTLVSEVVNDKFLEVAGKTYTEIHNKFYWEPFAEARPYYEKALDNAICTGEPYFANEVGLMLIRKGIEEWIFVTFVYVPLKNEMGLTTKVAIWVLENKQQAKSRQALTDLNKQLSTNAELKASNIELAALNQKLNRSQAELRLLNADLERRSLEVVESEERFRTMADGSEVMISVNDISGNVKYVNQAWLNLLGRTQEEMVAFGWGDFVHPDDREQLMNEFDWGIKSRKPFSVDFRMLDRNDQPRWISTKINPRLLPDGSYDGSISSSTDVTERKLYQDLLTASNDDLFAANEELSAANEEQSAANEELSFVNKQLNKLRREAEQAEHTLRVALEAANFGTWHIDAETRKLVANDRLKEIFGFAANEQVTLAGCIAKITDEYRDIVTLAVEEAINKGVTYDLSYTVCSKEGEDLKWVRAVGNLKADINGELVAFTGVLLDIQNRNRTTSGKTILLVW